MDNKLIKMMVIRVGIICLVLILGVIIGSQIQQSPISPWESVRSNIRESVKEQILKNPELTGILSEEKIEKFMDCTMDAQMKFLKESGCHPKSQGLADCLDSKHFQENIEKVNSECLLKINK